MYWLLSSFSFLWSIWLSSPGWGINYLLVRIERNTIVIDCNAAHRTCSMYLIQQCLKTSNQTSHSKLKTTFVWTLLNDFNQIYYFHFTWSRSFRAYFLLSFDSVVCCEELWSIRIWGSKIGMVVWVGMVPGYLLFWKADTLYALLPRVFY